MSFARRRAVKETKVRRRSMLSIKQINMTWYEISPKISYLYTSLICSRIHHLILLGAIRLLSWVCMYLVDARLKRYKRIPCEASKCTRVSREVYYKVEIVTKVICDVPTFSFLFITLHPFSRMYFWIAQFLP